MKAHEKELRHQSATRSIHWGGIPIAVSVDDEFGPLLAAAPDMARALFVMGHDVDGEWHTATCASSNSKTCLLGCSNSRAALKKAGLL